MPCDEMCLLVPDEASRREELRWSNQYKYSMLVYTQPNFWVVATRLVVVAECLSRPPHLLASTRKFVMSNVVLKLLIAIAFSNLCNEIRRKTLTDFLEM